MKAVCVMPRGKGQGWTSDITGKKITGPEHGDWVTVTGSVNKDGNLFYILKEWQVDDNEGWLASCFVPVTEGFQSITFEKVLETELTSVN